MNFLPKYKRKNFLKDDCYLGYTIRDNHIYLGCNLDLKLTGNVCFNKFIAIVNHIQTSLSPILYNCSLEYKKNLWQVFIQEGLPDSTPSHEMLPQKIFKPKYVA